MSTATKLFSEQDLQVKIEYQKRKLPLALLVMLMLLLINILIKQKLAMDKRHLRKQRKQNQRRQHPHLDHQHLLHPPVLPYQGHTEDFENDLQMIQVRKGKLVLSAFKVDFILTIVLSPFTLHIHVFVSYYTFAFLTQKITVSKLSEVLDTYQK